MVEVDVMVERVVETEEMEAKNETEGMIEIVGMFEGMFEAMFERMFEGKT